MGLGASQIDRGWEQVRAFFSSSDHHAGVYSAEEHVVDGELNLLRVEAQGVGETSLGVEINEQDLAALLGHGRPQGSHSGGLCDAALLIGHGNDSRHDTFRPRTLRPFLNVSAR